MKKYSKILSLVLALAMILPGFVQPAQAAEEIKLERLAGNDRVETAIKVSQEAYEKADTVVLAGYNGEADALTGTLLAKDKNAPVLLTYKDKLDADLVAELNRLGAKNVYILGGDTVVFPAVETALKDAGFKTTRLKGDTRVETAIAIATEVFGSATPAETFAVEYNSLADALAIGPVAANKKAPILITYKNDVPAKTEEAMKAMQVKDLTVVGGENTVSEKGIKALQALTGKTVARVSGLNRDLTSLEIANKYFANPKAVVVANGYKSADALVGGYFAAKIGAPILLTNTNTMHANVLDFIKEAQVNTYVLGGLSAVSADVYSKVEEALKGTTTPEVPVELKVESVSAINAEEIKVTFNKDVDVDTASNTAAYEVKLNNVKQTLYDTINVDGKEVIIRVNGIPFRAGDILVVQVNDSVKATTGENVERYASDQIVYGVKQEPKLVKTVMNTATKVLTLNFDRPVKVTTGIIKVDGVALSPTKTLASAHNTSAGEKIAGNYRYSLDLTGTNLADTSITEGNHEVVIFDVQDTASANPVKASTVTSTYTVAKDTETPQVVGITAINSNKFFIEFNKTAKLDDINSLKVKKGNHTFATLSGNNPSVTSSVYYDEGLYAGKPGVYVVVTKDSLTGDANPLYADGESSVNLNITLENYKVPNTSLVGSKYQGTVTLSKIDNKPVVKNAITNGNDLVITFESNISDVTSADVVVRDKDGIIVTPISVTEAGNEVTVKLADTNKAPYTIEFKADKFYYLNDLATVKGYVVRGENNDRMVVTPIANNFKLKVLKLDNNNVTTNKDTFEINYGTLMDNSAINVANYKLDGKALPTGTTVDFVGAKTKVRVSLPKETIKDTTSYKLTVDTNVRTAAGEYIVGDLQAKTPAETIITLQDNVKPVLSSAKYIVTGNTQETTREIEVKFSEKMGVSTNSAKDNFVVMVNGAKQEVATVKLDTNDTSKARLTLGSDVNVGQIATITVKSKNNINNIKDSAGNEAVEGTSVTTTGKEVDTDAIAEASTFKTQNTRVLNLNTNTVTINDETEVNNAINAYNLLSNVAKSALKAEKESLDKLKDQIAKLKTDKAAADAVKNMITQLGEVDNITLENKEAVKSAKLAFNRLTNDQKDLVVNIDVLTNMGTKIKELSEEALKDSLSSSVGVGNNNGSASNFMSLEKLSVTDKTVTADFNSDNRDDSSIKKIYTDLGDKNVDGIVTGADGIAKEARLYAIDSYVMNTLSRYLGALERNDSSKVEKIVFEDVEYIVNGEAKGSNWKAADGTSLVSQIVKQQDSSVRNVTFKILDEDGNFIDVNFLAVSVPAVTDITEW